MSEKEILFEERGFGPDGLYRKVKTRTVFEEAASLRVIDGPESIELVYVEGRGPFTTVVMTPEEARHIAGLLLAAACVARGAEKPQAAPDAAAQLRLECLRLALGSKLGDYVNLARDFYDFVAGSTVKPSPSSTAATQDQANVR